MRAILGLLVALVVSCCPSHSKIQVPLKTLLKDNLHLSVAVLEAQIEESTVGAGSVFAYSEDHLITAKHVCESMLDVKIFEDGTLSLVTYDDKGKRFDNYNVEIYNMSEYSDVCIVEAPGHGLHPVVIHPDYNLVSVRDEVKVIGAPLGLAIGEFDGKVMNPKIRHISGFFYNKLLISAPITQGISGSPVFDKTGFVIGMVVAVSPKFSRVDICETAETLHLAIGDMIR